MRSQNRILLNVLVIAVLGCLSTAAAASAERPNIVLIVADDMGYSDLGCYGSEIATPNLDQLARRGTRFNRFYNTPRCCPTRAALLTGVYPHQAGIGDMMQDRGIPAYRGEISSRTITVAEELRQAGYRTLMSGKWHISHIDFDGKRQQNFESDAPFWDHRNNWPMQRGFDDFYGTIHGVNSYYDPFSLVRGNTPVRPDGPDFYYTDAISENAVAQIGKAADDRKPFFLYLAYTAPHWPLQAPEEDIAKYRDTYMAGWDVIRSNRHRRQLELGLIDKSWPLPNRDPRVPAWKDVSDKAWQANRMATYAAMVERMDRGIGHVLAALREHRIEDNTLVIFISDNGACDEPIEEHYYDVPTRTRDGRPIHIGNKDHTIMAGPETTWQSYGPHWANVSNTPFRRYKHHTHEGGISSPFIACWPGVITRTNSINNAVGHIIDLMPTFVDAAAARHARSFNGQPVLPFEGVSLLPVLKGQSPASRPPLFWEHEGNRAVRDGKWKLVARGGGEWELYDMEADRTELQNLARQHPDRVKAMSRMYDQWAARCGVMPFDQLPKMIPIVPAKDAKANPDQAESKHS